MHNSNSSGETSSGANQEKPLAEALREIRIFSDLAQEEIDWLVNHAEDLHFRPDDVVFRMGGPADRMAILLKGEMHFRQDNATDSTTYIVNAGMVTGKLPYSRMTQYRGTGWAFSPMRIATIRAEDFPEMLHRIPILGERLVQVMADRIREAERADLHREKLVSLGKISAGIAHELNNPAAAARRAAQNLRTSLHNLRNASLRLLQRDVSLAQFQALMAFETKLEEQQRSGQSYLNDQIAQSDREEDIVKALEERGVPEPWKLAPTLAELCVDRKQLEAWAAKTGDLLADFLARIVSYLEVSRLVDEIDASAGRISTLVKAVKEYSWMDRTDLLEVDVNQGIENTLTIMAYRLKKGVSVVRDYDKNLPKICAHGSQMNQVWTNLIENAVDAMHGQGELRIRTAPDKDRVLVEISDNGQGIPKDVQPRIFDPFFTTKGVGEGTGLGLDIVARVVRLHHGEVRVFSEPGNTRFQIFLPLRQPRAESPEIQEVSDAQMHTS